MLPAEIRLEIYRCYEDVLLAPLHDPRVQSNPLAAPPYAIGLGETRPSKWNYRSLDLMLNYALPQAHDLPLTRSRLLARLADHAARYRLSGPPTFGEAPLRAINPDSQYPPALLLVCKQIHHEARHVLGRTIAVDFIPFDAAHQCWVRSLSPLAPRARAARRELAVTIWDMAQPLQAPPGLESDPAHARRLTGIVSDLRAVLRLGIGGSAPGLVRRVRIEVEHLARGLCSSSSSSSRGPQGGEVIDTDEGLSSYVDLRLDVDRLLGQFLLQQTGLETLVVGGCDVSRVFAPEDLAPLRQRGVRVVGRDRAAGVAGVEWPADLYDHARLIDAGGGLEPEEQDWEEWEREFGEG